MPGQLRISHLYVVLGVGLAHVILIFFLFRDKPTGLVTSTVDIIPVIMVSPPPQKENPPPEIIRPKPVRSPPAKISTRKSHPKKLKAKTDTEPAQKDNKTDPSDTTNLRKTNSGPASARRSGAFIVRRRTGASGTLGIFYRGFDCVRLNPVFYRGFCPPDPVDLMQGKQAKIAAVSARMARMHAGTGRSGKTFGIIERAEPGSSRRPLSTKPPTGAAILDENFAKIPPEYPDPAFGD